jgi:hypothetical protein
MTGRGSVTPGMACGSRPVKSGPERGAFPTVGINLGPGLPRGRPFPPWSAPANGRLANRPSGRGGNGLARISNHRNQPEQTPPRPSPWKKGEGAKQQHRELRVLLQILYSDAVNVGLRKLSSQPTDERWLISPMPALSTECGQRVFANTLDTHSTILH